MAKVIWTLPALEDIHSIFEFVAKDSLVYAEKLVIQISESPRRLESFPKSGRVVPEFNDESIRELVFGSYRIIYWIRGEACYIVAVAHGGRDILRHWKSE